MNVCKLRAVQSKMTASILNALSYNQHYPHSVAFAPQHVFGVGIYDVRIEQGLAQIQAILDYIGTDHKVGKVILIYLRQLQAEAGVSSMPSDRLLACWHPQFLLTRRHSSLHQK
jgi:hypothetical protein